MKRKSVIIIVSIFVVSVLAVSVLSVCSIGRFAFNSMQRVSQGMHFRGNPGDKENKDSSNESDFRNMPCNPENKNFKNKQQFLNNDRENTPFMGIEMAGSGDAATGVLVNSVISGSPAEKAGIKAQDTITAVDGKEVKSPPELSQVVLGYKVGDTIKVTINRSGQSLEISVTLESISSVLPNNFKNGQGTGKEQNGLNGSEKSGQEKSGQTGSDTY
jgi:membrane-associated protease RseP (regulator of RpoE activity)